jgi:signal transduction histidine kinase/ActR/RegA family two-component response regulator
MSRDLAGPAGAADTAQTASAAPPRPRMRWASSIRTKLVGVVLLTTLVALGVALGSMVAIDLSSSRQLWIDDMTTQADLLGQSSATALAFDDAKVAAENLALLHYRPQVRAAAVYDAKGVVFATYLAAGEPARFPPAPRADAVVVDEEGLVLFKRIAAKGDIVGTVYLRSIDSERDRIRGYVGIAVGVALLAMVVAGALSFWLQRIVTRPILAIDAVAGDIVAQGDYSRRAPRTSNDEVGRLVDSFNRMMAEIESRARESQDAVRALEHEVGERRQAQEEVMRLNTGLERRVADRTAALEASNQGLMHARLMAENANRAKSEFLSSMSHELRTPLNAIMGFGQLLANTTVALPEAKRLEFTRHIVNAGSHLLDLINEILDLARIESSNVMLSLEPVAVDDVLQECRTMIGPTAQRRRIRLLLPQDLQEYVVADRTRLRQVLLNLLSNAVKYNRENGRVTVDVHAGEPGHVRIAIQDTGAGLRPDQLASLFQPFNRLGQEAGAVEGTGIGLVVTKRLVELMGGSIGVESTLEVGSVFSIELKAATPAPTASLPASGNEATAAATPRAAVALGDTLPLVLHVEDNPANLRLVREILDLRADVRQISAPDARLGIDLARTHLPRIILLDINLPGMNGLDALSVLQSDPATASIPVIAITANAMAGDVARGLSAGFFRYVTKPIDMARLNDAVDAALAAALLARGPT